MRKLEVAEKEKKEEEKEEGKEDVDGSESTVGRVL